MDQWLRLIGATVSGYTSMAKSRWCHLNGCRPMGIKLIGAKVIGFGPVGQWLSFIGAMVSGYGSMAKISRCYGEWL